MRDFPTRPKGTVMSGAFRNGTEAERALRVLKNAGYARADVVADSEAVPGAAVLIVVDAAVTGAFRAAEILEEYGAEIRFETAPAFASQAEPVAISVDTAGATFATPSLAERKPRVRKRNRLRTQPATTLDPADVLIITRGIESVSR